jgi:hypothetical protein
MTRNILGLARENTSWLDSEQSPGFLSRLSEEAILVAVKTTLNTFANLYVGSELDKMYDVLSQVPVCSTRPPETAEFSCGVVAEKNDPSPQEIMVSDAWVSNLSERKRAPRPGVSAGEEWSRIFGALMPYLEQIDIVDGYLINDLKRQSSILEEIVESAFSNFDGKLMLHFLRPTDIETTPTRQFSEGALARRLAQIRSHLSPVAQRKFGINICQKKLDGRAKVKFHDRHLYFSFSGSTTGVYHSLGNGIDTFDPSNVEGSLGRMDSGAWNGIDALLTQLRDENLTQRVLSKTVA